jgi:alpha-N-arabinofuranosidase
MVKSKKYILQIVLLILLLLPVVISAQKNIHAKLNIGLASEYQLYDRMIFGQFIEHFHRQVYGGIFDPGSKLSDEKGFRTDVIDALREMKVPVVRWPGGCFASSYHWLNGIGNSRVPAYDKAWQVEEPNTFGTDEFVLWCRKIGAEPFICTNAGTGTMEEMSDWVEYCNLNIGKFGRMRQTNGQMEPFNVKYWSIGNENWGGHEIGAKSIAEWGPLVCESAKMMRRVTPDIKLFAAALSNPGWTLPLLKAAGGLLDFVSIHNYWDGDHDTFKPASYIDCMMRTNSPADDIKKTISILDQSGLRGQIKIAFDEWNLRGWLHPGLFNPRLKMDIESRDKNDINSTYTMADALFTACFLNTCIRNAADVKMACFSPIVNASGVLFVHPKGLVKRTTYHVMRLYANRLQPNSLPLEIISDALNYNDKSVNAVDAIVTCDNAKKLLTIALVNKHPEMAADCDLGIKITPRSIIATILSGDCVDTYNDIDSPNKVIPETRQLPVKDGHIIIPPHSLVIIDIPVK